VENGLGGHRPDPATRGRFSAVVRGRRILRIESSIRRMVGDTEVAIQTLVRDTPAKAGISAWQGVGASLLLDPSGLDPVCDGPASI